mmetsp:Transcript_22483/g.53073  ORF Transcript_22483/g.53073 Transcript_22483/m.53073 type:complete len:88 (-) Transcript_22483:721-984(-)
MYKLALTLRLTLLIATLSPFGKIARFWPLRKKPKTSLKELPTNSLYSVAAERKRKRKRKVGERETEENTGHSTMCEIKHDDTKKMHL